MLPNLLTFPLERVAAKLVAPETGVDFRAPLGEAAIIGPDSVSWQVFRNPVTMFIGGIAAVLLELGEPRVRTAVWEHSSFRRDPAGRLRRTGMAAMITVYGARSTMEALTARVRAMHDRIGGTTPNGMHYRAADPELLRWVQGTAAFAFITAYRAYVRPVSVADRARYYAEGVEGGSFYGVDAVPGTEGEIERMIDDMRPRLEPSPILHELMTIVRAAPILPALFRPVQHLVVRAAVDLLPVAVRRQLGIEDQGRLGVAERFLLRSLAAAADRAAFPTSPAAQACRRLGLPADYLVMRKRGIEAR